MNDPSKENSGAKHQEFFAELKPSRKTSAPNDLGYEGMTQDNCNKAFDVSGLIFTKHGRFP